MRIPWSGAIRRSLVGRRRRDAARGQLGDEAVHRIARGRPENARRGRESATRGTRHDDVAQAIDRESLHVLVRGTAHESAGDDCVGRRRERDDEPVAAGAEPPAEGRVERTGDREVGSGRTPADDDVVAPIERHRSSGVRLRAAEERREHETAAVRPELGDEGVGDVVGERGLEGVRGREVGGARTARDDGPARAVEHDAARGVLGTPTQEGHLGEP